MAYGKVTFVEPSDKEDQLEGIDGYISGIPVAWRKRRISILKHKEISIRYSRDTGTPTEFHKLLDGSFKPQLYFFQFTDAIVICKVDDIIDCLKSKKYIVAHNKIDGTEGCYIKTTDIAHRLVILKK